MEFLDFLNVMKENFHNATFQEKCNALGALGVEVYIHQIKGGSDKKAEKLPPFLVSRR